MPPETHPFPGTRCRGQASCRCEPAQTYRPRRPKASPSEASRRAVAGWRPVHALACLDSCPSASPLADSMVGGSPTFSFRLPQHPHRRFRRGRNPRLRLALALGKKLVAPVSPAPAAIFGVPRPKARPFAGTTGALPPERRTPIRHGAESCRNAPDRSPALQITPPASGGSGWIRPVRPGDAENDLTHDPAAIILRAVRFHELPKS